jgi:uncharacterized protein
MKSLNLFLITLLLLVSCTTTDVEGYEFKTICNNNLCFDVFIPKTTELKMQGLMFVEELNENEGMLFVFENKAKHSFWMKNTLVPLDMLWLDETLTVVHIEKADPCITETCTIYSPQSDALYVLEINQGLSEKNNITIGSNFYFS